MAVEIFGKTGDRRKSENALKGSANFADVADLNTGLNLEVHDMDTEETRGTCRLPSSPRSPHLRVHPDR
jgi:hypothetical protein